MISIRITASVVATVLAGSHYHVCLALALALALALDHHRLRLGKNPGS